MSGGQTTNVVLDAGAFVAWERNDQRVRALVQLAEAGEVTLRTSSGVVAQVWRGGSRQARLARLLVAAPSTSDPSIPPRLARSACWQASLVPRMWWTGTSRASP